MTDHRSLEAIQADISAAVARGDNEAAAAFLPEWQAANHAAAVAQADAIIAATPQRRYTKSNRRCW